MVHSNKSKHLICKFKAKKYKIKDGQAEICLGNISKYFSVYNMKKKTGLYGGNVRDFNIDFASIAINGILDIHKYLMEKNNIV